MSDNLERKRGAMRDRVEPQTKCVSNFQTYGL